MKIQINALKRSEGRSQGFTLIELLIVMAIIAILATLSLGAFRYAQEAASRNRTSASLAAIRASLEQYKEKFGEYPEPKSPDQVNTFSGQSFRVGGALMLYQAITGDGTDALKLSSSSSGTASDLNTDADELPNAINAALPKQMFIKASGGYLLVDGFGRPFQYDKAGAAGAQTINPTYDLWSYGNIQPTQSPQTNLSSKTSSEITGTWIKNW